MDDNLMMFIIFVFLSAIISSAILIKFIFRKINRNRQKHIRNNPVEKTDGISSNANNKSLLGAVKSFLPFDRCPGPFILGYGYILLIFIFITPGIYYNCFYVKQTATITQLIPDNDPKPIDKDDKPPENMNFIYVTYEYQGHIYKNIPTGTSNNHSRIGNHLGIYINPENPIDIQENLFEDPVLVLICVVFGAMGIFCILLDFYLKQRNKPTFSNKKL